MKLREFITLLPVAMEHGAYSMRAALKEVGHYGAKGWWWKLKLLLFFAYLFERPYGIMEKNRGNVSVSDENLVYGETPLLTVHELLGTLQPQKEDVFYDLGCGRGLTCFYSHILFGIPCHGIDIIPEFIEKARSIGNSLGLKEVSFSLGNVLDCDISDGTIFFVAGTTFDDTTLNSLGEKLEKKQGRATVISLSSPLPAPSYRVTGSGNYPFSWGSNSVYIQEKER
jgi:hypothetical protein